MKYVSRIVGGNSDRVVSPFCCSVGQSELFVCDNGVESPWDGDIQCIGIATENDIAVLYSSSELAVLKYINGVHCVKSAEDGGAGLCRSISSLLDDPDDNVCLVSAPDEIFLIMGYQNSVIKVLRDYCSVIDYITVAAWLGHLSREIGSYIFDKPFLYIDGALNNRVVLELDTGVEAQNYFTRLYLLGKQLW